MPTKITKNESRGTYDVRYEGRLYGWVTAYNMAQAKQRALELVREAHPEAKAKDVEAFGPYR